MVNKIFIISFLFFHLSNAGMFDWFRLDRAANRRIDEGKEQFLAIKANANSNLCWQGPVQELEQGCSGMNSEERGKLAVLLSSCHLSRSGKRFYPCSREMTLHECTQSMDVEGFNVYTQFSIHIDNICYYLESEYYQNRLERTINDLHKSAGEAQEVFLTLHEKTNKIDENSERVLSAQQELVLKNEQLSNLVERTAKQQNEAMESARESLKNLQGLSNSILQDSVEALGNQAKLLSDLGEVKYEQGEMKKVAEQSLQNQRELLEFQLRLQEQQQKVKEHAQSLLENLEKLEMAQSFAFSNTNERLLILTNSSNETISKLIHHYNLISSTLEQLATSLELIKSLKQGIAFDSNSIHFIIFYAIMIGLGILFTWPSRTNRASLPVILGSIISMFMESLIPESIIHYWRLVFIGYVSLCCFLAATHYVDYQRESYLLLRQLMEKQNQRYEA